MNSIEFQDILLRHQENKTNGEYSLIYDRRYCAFL